MFLSAYFLMVSSKVGPTRDRLGTLMSSITWRPEEDAARRSATPLLDRKEHSKTPFGKNKHMDYTTFAILTLSACAEFGSYAFVHPILRDLPQKYHIQVVRIWITRTELPLPRAS